MEKIGCVTEMTKERLDHICELINRLEKEDQRLVLSLLSDRTMLLFCQRRKELEESGER